MPVPITATIQGHPWDLWGLANLFDGTDSTHTHVKAQEPKGRPSIDTTDPQAVARFRAVGYDTSATLISDELVWQDDTHKPDLRDMREAAETLLARVNGIGHFLDPEFRSARLQYLSFQAGDSAGSMPLGDWEPNRSETFLGRQSQPELAQDILRRSSTDSSVQFVLNAVALPRTWSSMYLVFEAIATDVGGQHKLTKKGWITAAQQSDFTHAANNSRNFAEGSRHASKQPPLTKPLISLHEAYVIITQLIFHWFDSKR